MIIAGRLDKNGNITICKHHWKRMYYPINIDHTTTASRLK